MNNFKVQFNALAAHLPRPLLLTELSAGIKNLSEQKRLKRIPAAMNDWELQEKFISEEVERAKGLAPKIVEKILGDKELASISNWETLPFMEKERLAIRLCYVLSKHIAGDTPNNVFVCDLPFDNANFLPCNLTIEIGTLLCKAPLQKVLTSLAHETTHFRQWLFEESYKTLPQKFRPIRDIFRYETAFYIPRKKDEEKYRAQLCERHARAVGIAVGEEVTRLLAEEARLTVKNAPDQERSSESSYRPGYKHSKIAFNSLHA